MTGLSGVVICAVAFAPYAQAQAGRGPDASVMALASASRDADLRGDWVGLRDAHSKLEEAVEADPARREYYLGYADWRSSSLAFMTEGLAGSGAMQQEAVAHFDRALVAKPGWIEARLLRAFALSGVAASDPTRAAGLYAEVQKEVTRLMTEAPANPRVQLIAAMISSFGAMRTPDRLPSAWQAWARANDAFPAVAVAGDPAWGQAEGWAWLGGMQLAAGATEAARTSLERALVLRPDFWWVRQVALPQALHPRRR